MRARPPAISTEERVRRAGPHPIELLDALHDPWPVNSTAQSLVRIARDRGVRLGEIARRLRVSRRAVHYWQNGGVASLDHMAALWALATEVGDDPSGAT